MSSNNAMENLSPSEHVKSQMLKLQNARNNHDMENNDIWYIFNQEIHQQIDEVLKKLEAILAELKSGRGTTAVWPIVQLLVAKIGAISDELQEGPIAAQNDFDSVAKALAVLEEDIKNLEKKGELDPTGQKPRSGVSKEDAEKFAKDLKAYQNATKQWIQDYNNPNLTNKEREKYFNQDGMFDKNLDILNSIQGQGTPYGSIAELVAKGDMDGLQKVLASLAYFHGEIINDKKNYDDVLDDWMTGNSWFCKSDGIDVYLHTELQGAIAENNDLLNRDGNLINNAVSVASSVVKTGTDQQQYMVQHQIAN